MKIERPQPGQPFPPDAKCVFKGVIFDVYQWQQEMYDGTTATFERLKRADTAVVVPVTSDGRIILLEQEQPGKPPFLGLAGGRLEEGEDVETAARRELLEETGYEPGELVLLNAQQPYSKLDWAVYTFVARGCHKVAEQALDGGEKISLRFITFDELVELISREDFMEKELALMVLRARQNPAEMQRLRELFS